MGQTALHDVRSAMSILEVSKRVTNRELKYEERQMWAKRLSTDMRSRVEVLNVSIRAMNKNQGSRMLVGRTAHHKKKKGRSRQWVGSQYQQIVYGNQKARSKLVGLMARHNDRNSQSCKVRVEDEEQ